MMTEYEMGQKTIHRVFRLMGMMGLVFAALMLLYCFTMPLDGWTYAVTVITAVYWSVWAWWRRRVMLSLKTECERKA